MVDARGGSSGSSKEIQCLGCYETLKFDHIGIKCPQSHDICEECVPGYLQEVFSNPESSIPPKCLSCNSEIPARVFERHLDKTQLGIYQLVLLSKKLGENECTMACPKCSYFEVWFKSSTSCFFHCKKEDCLEVTCVYCKTKVEIPNMEDLIALEQEFNEEEELESKFNSLNIEEDKYEENLQADKGVFYHYKCAELNSYKKAIDDALERGEKVPCPECGLAGRKDNNCTHMTCTVCQIVWCYFCGLKESDCDREIFKEKEKHGIYRHNIDWEINEKRCPMYFMEISEVDNRWPENDVDCLNRFHRYRTLKEFKRVIQTIGQDNYTLAFNHFNSVKNCGYTLKDLNDPLIKKPLIVRDHSNESEDRESSSLDDSSSEVEHMEHQHQPEIINFLRYSNNVTYDIAPNTTGQDNYTLTFNHLDSVNDPLINNPLIVRDHLNQILDESDSISDQSREERSDRDSEDPDVVLRFDEGLLRILYPNTYLELIQQESLRRGQGARRRQHRGRGAGEHRERQDFPIGPGVQAGIRELIAMQESAIRPEVEAVREENRGRRRRRRGRRGRGRGDN